MNKRLDYIDIAKGLGIIFVVVSHIQLGFLSKFISSFYMPLFFFLSGAVFKVNTNLSLLEFLNRKVKSLLVPYFKYSFLFLFIYILYDFINKIDLNILLSIKGIFYSRYRITDVVLMNISNNAMWFLTSLFITSFIGFLIIKYNKIYIQIFLIGFITILGIFLNYFLNFLLPWNLDTSFICILFYFLGYYTCNTYIDKFKKINFHIAILSLIVLIIITYFLSKYNSMINLSVGQYGNYIIFYINSILCIYIFISISYLLSKLKLINKVLEYIGKKSMIILIYHMISLNLLINPFICEYELLLNYKDNLVFGILIGFCIIFIILTINHVKERCMIFYENKKVNL